MGLSKKIYEILLKTKGFVNRKYFQSAFLGFLTVLLFFGVMNIYAQEDGKVSPQWEGTKRFHNIISGTDGEEDNMNSRQGLEFLNASWTVFSLMVPEATENSDEVLADSKIPYDLKRGLLGMTEDASYMVYASYPKIDIVNHLAQQWVPGYDQSVSGLYASGYQELSNSGIISLWNRVLNISYLIFVIVMITAGFMIMFRHKLGGQTMVTIGNVLPGVIVSLILATFSFALAGLIIDLGGFFTSIIVLIIRGNTDLTIMSTSNIFSLMVGAFTNVLNDLGKLSPIRTGIAGIDRVLDLTAIVVGVIGTIGTAGTLPLLLGIITAGIVFFGAVKVLIVLFKAYFNILLNTILGPIQITFGAFPGNRHMITNWFLGIFRNVMVFPLVLAIINIPNAIVASSGGDLMLRLPEKLTNDTNQTFIEAFVPNVGLNIGGGLVMMLFRIFILFFAAQAPKFLESWFPPDTPKPFSEAMMGARGSISKAPIIGTLFK